MQPEYKKKSIRSFVIRAGRMTDGQKNAFDLWWPKYGLSLYDGNIDQKEIFGRTAPLVVEAGFGMGASLLAMAQAEPDKDFIGIEVHPPGVGRLLSCAGEAEVDNLRVYMADANDVLNDCIPSAAISRFQLFFPDPWHKKKHHKRRIVQAVFIELVRQKLADKAIIHLATDWEHYADHMMEVMCKAPGFENACPEYQFSPIPGYRPTTKFETRGERLGHGIWDIVFSKS
ncbi:MAG: tRNA (guanine-N7-)-methyltransferase [Lentisphaeria bacterium]|jgi:tRNA (guanine-N7-)-methyltransferase